MLLQKKYQKLRQLLGECGKVLVAYSGGTDSAFLLAVAVQELGDNVLAVTAISPTSTKAEVAEAQQLAKELGVHHRIIHSKEMDLRDFVGNTAERCYICKYSRYFDLQEIAKQKKIPWVLDGSNMDDLDDYRPGNRAIKELGLRSPMQEVTLTKSEIRQLSRQMGLPTWNKPSSPCLASRIPYGQEITEEKLRRVEKAEEYLTKRGFSPLRVRHYPAEARIEISPEQFSKLIEKSKDITKGLRELGFPKVTLDLDGFYSGSLNKNLPDKGE
ncbi:PP-loop domain protein [Desulforamulus reducens MI-1]|uniref:PP-loop domain protein n=1 Tax=Desulforamulus reducens (strain ATCC BAA-1160 / DSM 100696 / MI-1) TaxID=349161 RepID=A4J0U7_DESRM|nr:PP-loop domain protein [Desulforamulus reducens MI-1]